MRQNHSGIGNKPSRNTLFYDRCLESFRVELQPLPHTKGAQNRDHKAITPPRKLRNHGFKKYNLREIESSIDLPRLLRDLYFLTVCATKKPEQGVKAVATLRTNLNGSTKIFAY